MSAAKVESPQPIKPLPPVQVHPSEIQAKLNEIIKALNALTESLGVTKSGE